MYTYSTKFEELLLVYVHALGLQPLAIERLCDVQTELPSEVEWRCCCQCRLHWPLCD